MQPLKWLRGLLLKFAQRRCAHRFGETKEVYRCACWTGETLLHPVTQEKIGDVWRQYYTVETKCEICGLVLRSRGYDQKPINESEQCTAQ